jgi:hypothetical protein
MADPNPALAFAVDLDSIRDRLATLEYFNGVTTITDGTAAAENLDLLPPWAFVSVPREVAEKSKLIGGHRQRVAVSISILFAVPAERADEQTGDVVEDTRKAVIRILLAWTPARAEKALEYERYQLRASGDGLVWAEVIMTTEYFLSAT